MSYLLDYLSAPYKIMYDRIGHYYSNHYNDKNISSSEIEDSILIDKIQIDEIQDENISDRLYPADYAFFSMFTFFGYPTHITDNIYLGSAFNAVSYYILKDLNIGLIVNVTEEISNWYPDEFTYITIPIDDDNKQSIQDYLESTYQAIKKYQNDFPEKKILVHCFMGASRSASIAIFYLMKTVKNDDGNPITLNQAIEIIKKKRSIVNPTFRLTKDIINKLKKKSKNELDMLTDELNLVHQDLQIMEIKNTDS